MGQKKRTRKDGERKFSINQNLTVCFVLRSTLRIIIDANLWKITLSSEPGLVDHVGRTSYNRPDATVNILISACLCVDTPASALPSDDLNTDEILTPGQSILN